MSKADTWEIVGYFLAMIIFLSIVYIIYKDSQNINTHIGKINKEYLHAIEKLKNDSNIIIITNMKLNKSMVLGGYKNDG